MKTNSDQLYPPRMSRSQAQLATSYAPGAMFIWEGGKGACMAIPVDGNPDGISVNHSVSIQIRENLKEFCQSWLKRGKSIPREAPVYDEQLLDDCYMNRLKSGLESVEIRADTFEFMRPDRMGYMPAPLHYQCSNCNKVKEFKSPQHQLFEGLSSTCDSDSNQRRECKWRQLDVVYVHWSGKIDGLSPYRYNQNNGELKKIPKCDCGNEEFKLFRVGNQFSQWFFQCTGCGNKRNVFQLDPFSYQLLKPKRDNNVPHKGDEYTMIPISLTASPVYYSQTIRFIVFDDSLDTIALLGEDPENKLQNRICSLLNYDTTQLDDAQIREQLVAKGKNDLWNQYESTRKSEQKSRESGDTVGEEILSNAANQFLQNWLKDGTIVKTDIPYPKLERQIKKRTSYARKFDPIRLAVEHDALRRKKIAENRFSSDLKQPHNDLCAEYGNPELEASYVKRVQKSLSFLGIEEVYLIGNLDMVEFSFGYTRVSPTPTTEQNGKPMPVRLVGFPSLSSHKRPIYVIEQQNEAFYFKLNQEKVTSFLQQNEVIEDTTTVRSLGAEYVENYQDFGPFLSNFTIRDDNARAQSRDIASFVYMLLHSMSHHVMHGISRFSGLDLSSMSEVIFPADLAFVVHRRGVTEDLGNLSSMWRDHNKAFMDYLIDRRELFCGSGTLCDQRGGACPACLMIPETSCIAGNQLLSRASLVGGRAPLWDLNQKSLIGYYFV